MHQRDPEPLPAAFCWSRFGPEAGEPLDQILLRKNAEREACGGTFYWGIGSAVGPALAALIAHTEEPEVLFSPIKSRPRPVDLCSPHIVRWSAGKGLFGDTVNLPAAVYVTSRWDPARPKTPRYALVCASDRPLLLEDRGELHFEALRNLVSSSPVGPSQVTAVVRGGVVSRGATSGRTYPVSLRARLVWPYLIRLQAPTPVSGRSKADPTRLQPFQLAV
jgi:hypothetical protein